MNMGMIVEQAAMRLQTEDPATQAVVPPPLYSSSESLLQATELRIIINSTDCHFNSFTNIDVFHATEHSFH
jgi:hypothetical protein